MPLTNFFDSPGGRPALGDVPCSPQIKPGKQLTKGDNKRRIACGIWFDYYHINNSG
jgi:hypothetical protein